METPMSTSLHVYANIHAFFYASRALGFRTALWRAMKSLYYVVRVVGGRRGSCVCHPRYLVCSIRVALWRHPNIM